VFLVCSCKLLFIDFIACVPPQETRDLLNRRDSADEKRAAELERKLDEQAREVELQITRDEASAAFLVRFSHSMSSLFSLAI
jgi:hypothetical protein